MPGVAADATALPEVVGDAGVLVDPDDVDGWTAAIDLSCDRRRASGGAHRPRAGHGPREFSARAGRRSRSLAAYRLLGGGASQVKLVVCPALRARRRADRRGDDRASPSELVGRGHRLHVVTSLPWYQHHAVEPGGTAARSRSRGDRRGAASPGSTRSRPTSATSRPGRSPSAGSRALAALAAARRPKPARRRARHVAAAHARARRLGGGPCAGGCRSCSTSRTCSPTSPSSSGCITDPRVIAAASWLERATYRAPMRSRCCPTTSRQRGRQARRRTEPAQQGPGDPELRRHRADPPGDRENAYRREFGLERQDGRHVRRQRRAVPVARPGARRRGRALAHEPDVVFVINGGGSARPALERPAAGLANVRFVDMQPKERLPEVLAAADVHVVPLRSGPGPVERAVEAVLDPRRRPPDRGQRRPGHRGRPHASSGPAPAWPCRPDDAEAFTKAARRACSTTPTSAAAHGRRRPALRRAAGPRRPRSPRPTRPCSTSCRARSTLRAARPAVTGSTAAG